MPVIEYNPEQASLLRLPVSTRVFLQGQAGSGKTTAGVGRMQTLLECGVPAGSILVLAPQRSLLRPYQVQQGGSTFPEGGVVETVTSGGLVRRMVELFWPIAGRLAGFHHPHRPPSFLTLETSQYYLDRLLGSEIDREGYFSSLVIDRQRLYGQILDDLNKSAVVGFPFTDIGRRLNEAWLGDPGRQSAYDQVQICASRFRQHCLANNLLDYSLQMEVFNRILWPHGLCREYLRGRYHHVIFDNIEEDTPCTHDLLCDWAGDLESLLVIYDEDAGYRTFLGADPAGALRLKILCDTNLTFKHTWVVSASINNFVSSLAILHGRLSSTPYKRNGPLSPPCIEHTSNRFFPQMLDWVAVEVQRLVEGGIPAGEIAILVPYLSDSVRFGLSDRIERSGIPVYSRRPSRSLRDDPPVFCLLTLARLAHPTWRMVPTLEQISVCLMQAIEDLDPVRAFLLSKGSYSSDQVRLRPFHHLREEIRRRVTYRLGELYEGLRAWIDSYQDEPICELDVFLCRLFGELLSQPGYGFHTRFDSGAAAARLIQSARKFRLSVGEQEKLDNYQLGLDYIHLVDKGVLAATSDELDNTPANAVLIAPAYSFLMMNRPVDIQFWLDAANPGWWERVSQPLSQPFVLSRNWPAGKVWSDADEYASNQESLFRLLNGLLHRCRKKIFLGICDFNQQGIEQKGPLLRTIQQVLHQIYSTEIDRDGVHA